MKIRTITKEERAEYDQMSRCAFFDWQEKPRKEEELIWIKPEHAFAVFDENKMVSSMINHHLQHYVRGQLKALSGIGDVATFPEHRNKGLVKNLFVEVFEQCRRDKIGLSMLQ